MGFQHFRDLLFPLHFRQSSDVQAHRNQGDTDRAGLADTHFPTQFLYIEDLDVKDITTADDIIMRHHPHSGGERPYTVIYLLWRLKSRLRVAARRQYHRPQQDTRDETP